MKKTLLLALTVLAFCNTGLSQTYLPVPVTGYNIDAVAENTTALATTGTAIDGSNFVLYSAFYGSLFSPAGVGLPNNGLISSGTSTYQMAPYTQNNLLYLLAGSADSLVLTTPMPYAAFSLLNFSTEGSSTMSVTIRFTDNTTQAFTNVTVQDWFNGTGAVITGFDRCSRTAAGTPAYVSGNPRMYANNFPLSCANRTKPVRAVLIRNNGASGRLCVAAVSAVNVPVYTASVTPIPCAGSTSSITILNSGGLPAFTYTWGTSPVQSAATATGLVSGSYNYTVADAGGCQFASTVVMPPTTAPMSPPLVLPYNNPVCSGQPVTFVATGASSYTWTGGVTNGSAFNPTASVNVQVNSYTVTGSNSCNTSTNSTVISLTVNPNPTITPSSSSPSLCSAGSLTLTGSGSSTTYTWSAGVSDGVGFVPAATNTYVVSGTNTLGCVASASIVIPVVITPTAVPVSSASFACIGSSVSLSAAGATSYTWLPGNVSASVVAVSPLATTVYTVTKANANCSDTKTISITVFGLPTVTAVSASPTVCVGAAMSLSATSTSPGSTYTWTPSFAQGAQVSVNPSGNTIYTVSAFNGTCAGQATVALTTVAIPTITCSASATNICEGTQVTLTASGGLSYTWSPNGGNQATAVVSPNAPVQYSVSGSNAAGCLAGATQIIIVNSSPTLVLSSSAAAICNGESATLTVNGANTYLWDNQSTNSSIAVSPLSTTVYSVTGTSTNSCSSTQTIEVAVFSPSLTVAGPTAVCDGETATLTASGANTYTWSPGFNQPVYVVTPTATAIYPVAATANSMNINCPVSATIQVTVKALPTVTAIASRTNVCRDETVTITASGANTYTWNTNVSSPSITATSSLVTVLNYTVRGTGANGCVNSGTVAVKVNGCTGLEETQEVKSLQLYPNPSGGDITIQSTASDTQVLLVNALGQLVQRYALNAANNYTVNVSNLSDGIYFVRVENAAAESALKLVVRH